MSIIGISGRIGSGKDTIGKIIQYLTLPGERGPYIGFQTYDDATLERNSSFKIKKFAGKLKQIGSLLTGIPIEMFEDQEFKKQYMPEEWSTEIWNDPDPIEGNDYRITSRIKYEDGTSLITYNDGLSEAEVFDHEIEKKLMTYREFLQKLGTEAMRDGLHTNVWVNALFADYKSKREILQADGTWIESDTGEVDFAVSIKYPKWIITDMRFPNEMEAVVEKGGITIRVVRQYSKEDLCKGSSPSVRDEALFKKLTERYKYMSDLPVVNIHPSETALDEAKFDYEVINDGSIEDLVEKVREVLIKENII